ncbi:MAG: hypothetical protein M1820_007258 [Bogoriella megaspora]|nr:MAG: hypothetical protein M1820_007258 [Bogoriella megaspora]
MAEALATISLAGNVIQFLTVSINVVSSVHELYKKGSLKSNLEVASTTGQIKGALDLLQNGAVAENDAELSALVVECLRLGDELMVILDGLKLDRRKNQFMEVTSKSLKSMRARTKIKDIERQLEKTKDAAALLPSLREINDMTRQFYIEIYDRLDRKMADLHQILDADKSNYVTSDKLPDISLKLSKLVREAEDSDKIWKILQTLHFKQMKERQSDVAEAHRDTFEWIFKKQTNINFIDWLQSSNGIYWISGKAGSGKSTLMKFLLHHPRTKELLGEWAKGHNLVIASHFFWCAGTAMQKSQEGLFKTLLFQILVQCPEIISQACPIRWSDRTFAWMEPWTRAELFHTFKIISEMPRLPQRVCLFIDGLDEYNGDHIELIDILRVISMSADIKICASSRPWQSFQDAYEKTSWKLYVHDLTKEDIRVYIRDNLAQNSRFQILQQKSSRDAAALIDRIEKKAQGVFLWVYLVVRSLLRGLLNRDEISDLHRRLEELPGELEQYFKLMLDTIEPMYQEQSARAFKIMVNASANLPLILFHFIDKEREDTNYVLHQEVEPFSSAAIADICDEKKRQLNARCRDLLHFTTDEWETEFLEQRVGFLHRTVMDFFQTGEMDTMLSSRCRVEFDSNSSLSKAYLAMVKAMYFAHSPTRSSELATMAHASILYATRMEEQSGRTNTLVLDNLGKVLNIAYKPSNATLRDSFPVDCGKGMISLGISMGLSLYVEEKLRDLQEKADKSVNVNLSLGRFLRQGLRENYTIEDSFIAAKKNEIDLSMLQTLLKLGADPNCNLKAHLYDTSGFRNQADMVRTQGKLRSDLDEATNRDAVKKFVQSERTVWADFLFQLQVDFSRSNMEQDWGMMRHLDPTTAPRSMPANVFEACQLMIEYGARRKYYKIDKSDITDDLGTQKIRYDRYFYAEHVFSDVLSDSQAASLVRLLRRHEKQDEKQDEGQDEGQKRKGWCSLM